MARITKGERVRESHWIESFWPLKWTISSPNFLMSANPWFKGRRNEIRSVRRIFNIEQNKKGHKLFRVIDQDFLQ